MRSAPTWESEKSTGILKNALYFFPARSDTIKIEMSGKTRNHQNREKKGKDKMNSYSCEAILKRHNPYWSQSPKTWDDSAFLGNGILGAAIYNAEHKSKRQTYRFVMGRVDVTARREGAYAARVPVGEFELDFGSWIYGGTTAEIDLYNARFPTFW